MTDSARPDRPSDSVVSAAGTPCFRHGEPVYHTIPGDCGSVSLRPTVTEYRVVCPDGMVTHRVGADRFGKVTTDYTEACDLRAARDAERGTASLHRDCGMHILQERTVTYGRWQ